MDQIGIGQLHWSTANYQPLQERALWDGLVALHDQVRPHLCLYLLVAFAISDLQPSCCWCWLLGSISLDFRLVTLAETVTACVITSVSRASPVY